MRGRKKGSKFPNGYKKVKNSKELVKTVKTMPKGSIVELDERKEEPILA